MTTPLERAQAREIDRLKTIIREANETSKMNSWHFTTLQINLDQVVATTETEKYLTGARAAARSVRQPGNLP